MLGKYFCKKRNGNGISLKPLLRCCRSIHILEMEHFVINESFHVFGLKIISNWLPWRFAEMWFNFFFLFSYSIFHLISSERRKKHALFLVRQIEWRNIGLIGHWPATINAPTTAKTDKCLIEFRTTQSSCIHREMWSAFFAPPGQRQYWQVATAKNSQTLGIIDIFNFNLFPVNVRVFVCGERESRKKCVCKRRWILTSFVKYHFHA